MLRRRLSLFPLSYFYNIYHQHDITMSRQSPSHSLPLGDLEDLAEARSKLSWRQGEDANTTHSSHHPSTSSPNKASPSKEHASSPRKSRTPRKSPAKNHHHNHHHRERRTLWREDDDATNKENKSKSSPLKSLGIDPEKFHRKRFSDPKEQQIAVELQEKIEKSLLSQEKLNHRERLEAQRKEFRHVTTLKTWPLQEMAMEHLDHLLDGKHSISQFHGGDYLSSESSSSTGSAAQGGKRRQTTNMASPSSSPARRKGDLQQPQHEQQTYDDEVCRTSLDDNDSSQVTGPLWSKEPRIFATEKAHGKRKYLVGHFGRIADWYWRKCVNKHLYEVIRERTPCRLYFDLEYSKTFNKDVNEDDLLNEFREEIAAEFKEHYQVTLEKPQIIDLDSSNESKFSRHWIVDLDQEGLFEDAPTVGRFVKRLVGRLAEEQATNQLEARRPTLAKYLFVQTKDANKPSCFIDLGVYTRNRLFRCFGSSKYGKPNALKVADSNEYTLAPLPESTVKADDDSSNELLTSEAPNIQTTTLEEYITANNWEPHASALAATLVIPLGGSEGKRIFRVEEDEFSMTSGGGASSRQQTGRVFQPAISIHASKTPFPSLEKYVLEVLGRRGGACGAIRAWSLEYGGPKGDIPVSITFQMCRNRFCELIGRTHKSNNIFWTIIFDSWTCIQGCHDPECFGRGAPVPIREDYLLSIKEEFEAWRDEEFEKALLALNLDDLPASTADLPRETPITNTTGSDHGEDSKKVAIMVKNAGQQGDASEMVGNGIKGGDEHDGADSSCSLSDEALLEAISANPELFP